MAQTNGKELLKDLDQVLIDNTEQNEFASADSDSSLLFESLDEYGTDAVFFSAIFRFLYRSGDCPFMGLSPLKWFAMQWGQSPIVL